MVCKHVDAVVFRLDILDVFELHVADFFVIDARPETRRPPGVGVVVTIRYGFATVVDSRE